MSFDLRSLSARVRELGARLTPAVLEHSQALYTPFHRNEPYAGVRVTRDIAYGTNERQRLDLFEPERLSAESTAAPVLVFVHGGGFVGGDKKRPGTPYHDNIALWAARHGMVGVNMTYRLAPASPWPAGAQDIAAAVNWLRTNAAEYGIAADRLWLLGTSAGAVHVASYVVSPDLQAAGGSPAIAGAIMLSGLYDIETAERNSLLRTYFGNDASLYRERSSLNGLIEARVPLMFGFAENDPADFEAQTLQLVNAWYQHHQRWPKVVRLMGHNHFTATLHFNTPDEYLGNQILDFMNSSEKR